MYARRREWISVLQAFYISVRTTERAGDVCIGCRVPRVRRSLLDCRLPTPDSRSSDLHARRLLVCGAYATELIERLGEKVEEIAKALEVFDYSGHLEIELVDPLRQRLEKAVVVFDFKVDGQCGRCSCRV